MRGAQEVGLLLGTQGLRTQSSMNCGHQDRLDPEMLVAKEQPWVPKASQKERGGKGTEEGRGDRGEKERDKREVGNMRTKLGSKNTWNGRKRCCEQSFIYEFYLYTQQLSFSKSSENWLNEAYLSIIMESK